MSQKDEKKGGLMQRLRRRNRQKLSELDDAKQTPNAVKREDTYERLSAAVRLGYGLPQFSMTSLTLVISIYGNPFYEKMGAGLSFIAFFTALARSFDVMTDPLMGWISDNTRTSFGRRRPYMLYGMFGFSLFFVILMSPPFTPSGDDSKRTSYHFGFFYIAFYIFDTIANVPYSALGPELTSDSEERSSVFFYGKLYAGVGTLIGATSPEIVSRIIGSTDDDMDSVRSVFVIIAVVFGLLYLLFMLFVVFSVKERQQSSDSPAMPLVPSVMRSFKNPAFRPLLVGWILDAIALSALAAMFPFFIAFVIRPTEYSVSFVQMACFGALFVAALVSMPVWKILASKFGKYRVWQAFNVLNFLTNSMFVFVGEGDPKATIAISALNGLPLGGTFLTDAILADVIDYDEFLNGSRNEGGFTVFATFIPKFVSVPAGALPLSLIAMIGFRPSVDGVDQEQPTAVKYFIRFMFVVVPCMCCLLSILAKKYYPIKTEEMVKRINDGIEMHHNKKPAEDPVTGLVVELLHLESDEQLEQAWTLDNFTTSELRMFLEGGAKPVIRRTTMLVIAGVAFTLGNAAMVAGFFNQLDDPAISMVPIICVVLAGMGTCFTVVSVMRLRAALSLKNEAKINRELTETIYNHKTKGQRGGDQTDFAEMISQLRETVLEMEDEIDTLKARLAKYENGKGGSSTSAAPATTTT